MKAAMNESQVDRSVEVLPGSEKQPMLLYGRAAVLVLAIAGSVYWVSGASERSAIEAVKNSLRDPDSAKFRSVRKVSHGFCGELNAKNAYGAMVGFEQFFVWARGGEAPKAYMGKESEITIRVMCEDKAG